MPTEVSLSSDPNCPANTGTQCETSEPQPAIPMAPAEALPALEEAVKAKDAARVNSLFTSLQQTDPDLAMQTAKDILKTILQDNSKSIMSLSEKDYVKLKELIDCLLNICGKQDVALAQLAFNLFVDRTDHSHAVQINKLYGANLEGERLKIALDKLVERATYTEPNRIIKMLASGRLTSEERADACKTLSTKYPTYSGLEQPDDHELNGTGQKILGMANLEDPQSEALARKTLADGLRECLQDPRWLNALDEKKYNDLVRFFEEFFKRGIDSVTHKDLAYSLVKICFTVGDYGKALSIANNLHIKFTEEQIAEAFRVAKHQRSIENVLKLATSGAAESETVKNTIRDILQAKLEIAHHTNPDEEFREFRDFILFYVKRLSGETSDKLFLLNPLIEFCVNGNRIHLAERLKNDFDGCFLEQAAYQRACQRFERSPYREEKLAKLLSLTKHAKSTKLD